jgi:hypothetical protein
MLFIDIERIEPNVDPRRRQELADSRMIYENHLSMSNLPERPIYHQFDANKYPERLSMYNQSSRRIK